MLGGVLTLHLPGTLLYVRLQRAIGNIDRQGDAFTFEQKFRAAFTFEQKFRAVKNLNYLS